MRTSENGIKLIKQFESLHDGDLRDIGLQPKMDPIGIWTEGYGHAIRDKNGGFLKGSKNIKKAYELSKIHNEHDATNMLINYDLPVMEKIVMQKVKVPLTQNQFDALVSHTYNTGGSQGLFALVNKKADPVEIKAWFQNKYVTGSGEKLPGLVRRRKAESDLFFKIG